MKKLFLIGQKLDIEGSDCYYNFISYDFGPGSVEVYEDVEELVNEGWIN